MASAMSSGLQGRELSLRVVFSCARVRTLRELRSHESGLDRDHPYSLCVYLHPEPFRDGCEGVLGGSVDGPVRPGDAPPGEAGDEDDVARAAAEHVTEGGAGRVEHPENVDLEHRAPAFGVRFRDGAVEPEPGVGDEDIYGAEARDRS